MSVLSRFFIIVVFCSTEFILQIKALKSAAIWAVPDWFSTHSANSLTETMKASIYNHCTVFLSLLSLALLLMKFRSVIASCFKCVVCSGRGVGITSIFSYDTLNIIPYT